MQSVIAQVEAKYMKKAVADVRPGDTVKVSQKVKEGSKERIQIFEGTVIRVSRKNSLTASLTVRRIASSVGVEKTFLMHAPSVLKVEIVKRSKVRRNYLAYLRERSGKKARMSGIEFDRDAVNVAEDETAEAEEEKLKVAAEKAHEEKEAKKAEKEAKLEQKAEEALAQHEEKQTD
jgi:large subunit ribosomal protein L19